MDLTPTELDVGLDTGRHTFIGICDMCELNRPLTHAILRNIDNVSHPATYITLLCATCGVGGA